MSAKQKAVVPPWMRELGIEPGEWFQTTKPAFKSFPPLSTTLKARIYITGVLATHGYQSEQPFTMRGGKRVPLSIVGLRRLVKTMAVDWYAERGVTLTEEQEKALEPSKQDFRRAIAALEDDGLAERRTKDGEAVRDLPANQVHVIPKGSVRLWIWARPRPPRNKPAPPAVAPDRDVPKEVRRLVRATRSLGFEVDAALLQRNASLRAELTSAVDAYQNDRKVAIETAKKRIKGVLGSSRFEMNSEMNSEMNIESESVSQSAAVAGDHDRPTDASLSAPYTTEDVARVLVEELGERLPGQMPSTALCRDVVDGLRGAPLLNLRQAIRRSFGKFTSMGLAKPLAVEVGERWQRDQAIFSAAEAEAAAKQRERDEEMIRVFRSTLEHPEATEEEREIARAQLEAMENNRVKGAGES